MYQCMKIAEFKSLQFGIIIIKYLECNKSFDGFYPGTAAQNSSRGTRVCGFPTPSWLHNDLLLPPDVPSS